MSVILMQACVAALAAVGRHYKLGLKVPVYIVLSTTISSVTAAYRSHQLGCCTTGITGVLPLCLSQAAEPRCTLLLARLCFSEPDS